MTEIDEKIAQAKDDLTAISGIPQMDLTVTQIITRLVETQIYLLEELAKLQQERP